MLLGGIADKLRGDWKGKRLLIVAGGALEYLPFAALPSPSSGQPLIAEHEVVNLPSASVLSAMRRETVGRQAATKAVAVLADPVFEENDPRVLVAKRRSADRDLAVNTRSAGEPQTPSTHSIRYAVDAFCQKHPGIQWARQSFAPAVLPRGGRGCCFTHSRQDRF